jgi:hypothetical protein
MEYYLTPEQERELQEFEDGDLSIVGLLANLETKSDSQDGHEKYRESLYTLIWDHVLKSTLYQLYLKIDNSDIPWLTLHTLECDWNTKPLNLPAFHSLEDSLNTTQLIPCRFIQSHRQSINSKLLVGSMIWFEKNLPQKKIQLPKTNR